MSAFKSFNDPTEIRRRMDELGFEHFSEEEKPKEFQLDPSESTYSLVYHGWEFTEGDFR